MGVRYWLPTLGDLKQSDATGFPHPFSYSTAIFLSYCLFLAVLLPIVYHIWHKNSTNTSGHLCIQGMEKQTSHKHIWIL